MNDGLDGWMTARGISSKFRLNWQFDFMNIHLILYTVHNDLIDSLKLNSKIKVDDENEGEENETIDIIKWHRSKIAISAKFHLSDQTVRRICKGFFNRGVAFFC